VKIYTIGFTKTSAENFFSRLKRSGAQRLIDVRLNNISQLAGFAKRDDLRFFSKVICGMEYAHEPLLAPTQEMLDAYKKENGEWSTYEKDFLNLLNHRRVELTLSKQQLDNSCLLCSEDKPHHCHRRLAVEYLRDRWHDVEVTHL
jgi:uncharacterized protein (DUF488 family)